MVLKSIALFNYRNHTDRSLAFEAPVVCITGMNGAGKTNVLDAIHVLSMSRSYFTNQDQQNIQRDALFTVVNGTLENDGKEYLVQCRIARGERKLLKLNHTAYERIADHLGFMPVVMISPFDISLLYEGSLERRKFLDTILAQTNKDYLQNLTQYNRCLEQRNHLLRNFSFEQPNAFAAIDAWNHQMAPCAQFIYDARKKFIETFTGLFAHYYQLISSGNEEIRLQYNSQLEHENAASIFTSHLQDEIQAQRSLYGIHKDDLNIYLGKESAKNFASQGQAKSIIIALKLAQHAYVKQLTGKSPILLLDDIFEKLDEQRAFRLMELISSQGDTQAFITDTHKDRVKHIFDALQQHIQYLAL